MQLASQAEAGKSFTMGRIAALQTWTPSGEIPLAADVAAGVVVLVITLVPLVFVLIAHPPKKHILFSGCRDYFR